MASANFKKSQPYYILYISIYTYFFSCNIYYIRYISFKPSEIWTGPLRICKAVTLCDALFQGIIFLKSSTPILYISIVVLYSYSFFCIIYIILDNTSRCLTVRGGLSQITIHQPCFRASDEGFVANSVTRSVPFHVYEKLWGTVRAVQATPNESFTVINEQLWPNESVCQLDYQSGTWGKGYREAV